MGLVKLLVDGDHEEKWTSSERAEPDYVAAHTVGYTSTATSQIIEKGINSEGRIPFFAPREIDYF